MTKFAARVLAAVRRIPPGRVATYGDVAALAGRPRAARAVGNIMQGCGRPDVPCHRVISAGGRLGGYGGHEVLKRSLLIAEGIRVAGQRVQNLNDVRVVAGRQSTVASRRRRLLPAAPLRNRQSDRFQVGSQSGNAGGRRFRLKR